MKTDDGPWGPGGIGKPWPRPEQEHCYHLSPALPASILEPSMPSLFPTPTPAYSPHGNHCGPSDLSGCPLHGLPVLASHLLTTSPPPTPPGSCLPVSPCNSLSLGQLFPNSARLSSPSGLYPLSPSMTGLSPPDSLRAHSNTATPGAPRRPTSLFPHDTSSHLTYSASLQRKECP